MIKCLNCDEENTPGSTHCKACGANLTTKKYKRDDDPQTKISKLESELAETRDDLKKVKEHLQKESDAKTTDPAKRTKLFG